MASDGRFRWAGFMRCLVLECRPAVRPPATGLTHGSKINPVLIRMPSVSLLIARARVALTVQQFVAAEELWRAVLEQNGRHPEALTGLGEALTARGAWSEAANALQAAVSLDPARAPGWEALAGWALAQGDSVEALVYADRALVLDPAYAPAHERRAMVFTRRFQWLEAEAAIVRALELAPNFPRARATLASIHLTLRQIDSATALTQAALQQAPWCAELLLVQGGIAAADGRLDEAATAFARVLETYPDHTVALRNLLNLGRYTESLDMAGMAAVARRWGTGIPVSPAPRPAPLPATPLARLRIGYLICDFSEHPVSRFLLPVLQQHDRAAFDSVVYVNSDVRDCFSPHIEAVAGQWHSVVALSDADLHQRIVEDGIAIAIDLHGHTGGNRLTALAGHPAPVQASWLGYSGSTGLPAIDYLIMDSYLCPSGSERFFHETLVRLPGAFLCAAPPLVWETPLTPPPSCTAGYVTFGCFQRVQKISLSLARLWAQVLAAVPGSRLLLKSFDLANTRVRDVLCARLAGAGIPMARVTLEAGSLPQDYYNRYAAVDVILDTQPFAGGATTIDALWMGIPVIALPGDRPLGRQGVSLLTAAGRPEWIAADAGAYVAKAVALATDEAGRQQIRQSLRAELLTSPLFDAISFTRGFETALRRMYIAK